MKLLIGVALALVFVIVFAFGRPKPVPFSAQNWATGTAADRGQMCFDPLFRESVLGKHSAEVIELLGPPPVDEFAKRFDQFYNGCDSILRYPVYNSSVIVCLVDDKVSDISLPDS